MIDTKTNWMNFVDAKWKFLSTLLWIDYINLHTDSTEMLLHLLNGCRVDYKIDLHWSILTKWIWNQVNVNKYRTTGTIKNFSWIIHTHTHSHHMMTYVQRKNKITQLSKQEKKRIRILFHLYILSVILLYDEQDCWCCCHVMMMMMMMMPITKMMFVHLVDDEKLIKLI